MSKFYIETNGPKSWQSLLADPVKHWKTGHSAKSLAYCWEEAEGFPESVISVFNKSNYELFHSIEFQLGIPEHQVPLPGGKTASQNDIFVLAKTGDELISIAVEGKVSEPFGPTVGEKLLDISSGAKERLNYLCGLLGIGDNDLTNIRYQLLHRTVSALIEADRFCAPHALMLVHSFSQSHEWLNDYQAFLNLFGKTGTTNSITFIRKLNNVDLYTAWVTGEECYLHK